MGNWPLVPKEGRKKLRRGGRCLHCAFSASCISGWCSWGTWVGCMLHGCRGLWQNSQLLNIYVRKRAISEERKGCRCRLELDDHSQVEQNIMRNDMNHINENSNELFRMSRARNLAQWSWRHCGMPPVVEGNRRPQAPKSMLGIDLVLVQVTSIILSTSPHQ